MNIQTTLKHSDHDYNLCASIRAGAKICEQFNFKTSGICFAYKLGTVVNRKEAI